MSNTENRARARARRDTTDSPVALGGSGVSGPFLYAAYVSRPEAAASGSSAAAHAGLADRSGPQSDHMAALVRRARRREARRRLVRAWFPRRRAELPGLPGVPTRRGVRDAVQAGFTGALPREEARIGASTRLYARPTSDPASEQAAPGKPPVPAVEVRVPDQRTRQTASARES